jgi:hypothetical protein
MYLNKMLYFQHIFIFILGECLIKHAETLLRTKDYCTHFNIFIYSFKEIADPQVWIGICVCVCVCVCVWNHCQGLGYNENMYKN